MNSLKKSIERVRFEIASREQEILGELFDLKMEMSQLKSQREAIKVREFVAMYGSDND